MDTTNARLTELRRQLNEPMNWTELRQALVTWMLESPETLPLGLGYVAEVVAIGDWVGRLAQLEEVAAHLGQVEDVGDAPALSAALQALDASDAESSPLIAVPRARLEALERLAAAAPAFQQQHGRCWSSGGVFKMEVERGFRLAVRALEEQDTD